MSIEGGVTTSDSPYGLLQVCSRSTFFVHSFHIVFYLSEFCSLFVSPTYAVLIKLSIKLSLSFVCCYPVVFAKLPHVFFYMVSEREG